MLFEKLSVYFKNKGKEKKCLNLLVKRKNVLGLPPTGFGKSLIYYLLEINCQAKHDEISHALKRNFVGAKIRNCEISSERKFALANFRQRENSQLRNFASSGRGL